MEKAWQDKRHFATYAYLNSIPYLYIHTLVLSSENEI